MSSLKSQRPRELGRRFKSTLAATFEMNFIELGELGFSDWIERSFAQSKPQHKVGWFHYNDDLLFHEALRSVVSELGPEVISPARQAITRVLSGIGSKPIGLIGLLEIFGTAEVLQAPNIPEHLHRFLSANIPAEGEIRTAPKDTFDAIALRETLEIAYRSFYLAVSRDELSEWKNLSKWAYETLYRNQHQQLLAPAYAPIYVISLLHLVQCAGGDLSANRKHIEKVLKVCIAAATTMHHELYVFKSTKYTVSAFPFNIDLLLRIGGDVFENLCSVSPARVRGRISMVSHNDPFGSLPASATAGSAPRLVEQAKECLDLLAADLELV